MLREGMRLSDVTSTDSYSWLLGELVIGGADVDDLDRKFEDAKRLLPFELAPLGTRRAGRDRQ
jgi:hypothetical protein